MMGLIKSTESLYPISNQSPKYDVLKSPDLSENENLAPFPPEYAIRRLITLIPASLSS